MYLFDCLIGCKLSRISYSTSKLFFRDQSSYQILHCIPSFPRFQIVLLDINNLNMRRSENCSEDFVQVLDHNRKTIQKLCGILYPKGLTSGSSLIRVSLQANGLTNYRDLEYGFEAWWSARNNGKVNRSLAYIMHIDILFFRGSQSQNSIL